MRASASLAFSHQVSPVNYFTKVFWNVIYSAVWLRAK